MSSNDAEIIQKIQKLTMPEPHDVIMWKNYIKEIETQSLDYHNVMGYVTKKDNQVVGYIYGFYYEKKKHGYINSIAVDPDFQKMGIGQLLLDEFIKWMSEFKPLRCSLHMRHHNNKAFRFYQENGFVVTGQLHNAVYMTKEFKPDKREEEEEEDEEEKSDGVTNTSDATMTTDTSGIMNPTYSGKKPAEIK